MEMIDLLKQEMILTKPRRLKYPSAWEKHIPFVLWLIHLTAPKMIVELGTYSGNSYFAMCQAVKMIGSAAQCRAVDTWKGDKHVGSYGEEVFLDVRQHNDEFYGDFSRLRRMTFDEALNSFSDGSVDLLHMDGESSYESSKHDFLAWRPKMSSRGIILIHDICVRKPGVTVWKLWEEIKHGFPVFEFTHQYGLGVVLVGPNNPLVNRWNIFDADDRTRTSIRKMFEHLGERNSLALENELLKTRLDSMLGSKSWRLTGPARKLYSWLRRLR